MAQKHVSKSSTSVFHYVMMMIYVALGVIFQFGNPVEHLIKKPQPTLYHRILLYVHFLYARVVALIPWVKLW